MRLTKPVLAILAIAVLAAPIGYGVLKFGKAASTQSSGQTASSIGGAFRMVDQDARPVSEQDLRGKPTAMFFGFTYCPEVCPTTLIEMTHWMEMLGQQADQLNVVFVSVDPARDTPATLKEYLSNFDPRIRGFTGTPEQVATITKAYKVYFKKVPLEGGAYTMDHSSMIYLMDREGKFVEPIAYGGPPERGLAQLKKLLAD